MSIRTYLNYQPNIDDSCYIDEAATIIGQVTIGKHCSIWPQAVIRGDVNHIKIGDYTNIQDGSILHCTHDGPYTKGGQQLIIGKYNTIGHLAMLHAAQIEDYCLIGMNTILLDKCQIGSHTLIAAGSLVPQNKILEPGYLWLGNPVKKIRKLSQMELDNIEYSAHNYAELAQNYLK